MLPVRDIAELLSILLRQSQEKNMLQMGEVLFIRSLCAIQLFGFLGLLKFFLVL